MRAGMMGFSFIRKTASTGSSATGALVAAGSLQPIIMSIQWIVHWWVLVHCGPTVGPLPFQQLLFKYLINFHSGSNDKNFLNFCHSQRADRRTEISKMTRPLLQCYTTSLLDSQKPKASRIGTWTGAPTEAFLPNLCSLRFDVCKLL
jgi:hypothetical protein